MSIIAISSESHCPAAALIMSHRRPAGGPWQPGDAKYDWHYVTSTCTFNAAWAIWPAERVAAFAAAAAAVAAAHSRDGNLRDQRTGLLSSWACQRKTSTRSPPPLVSAVWAVRPAGRAAAASRCNDSDAMSESGEEQYSRRRPAPQSPSCA